MRSTRAQKAFAIAACTAALVGAGASAASAGEITGKGRSLATVPNPNYDPSNPSAEESPFVLKAKSICAYSGLNDDWVKAQLDDDPTNDNTYPRTQNPAEAPPGVPGFACSPGRPLPPQ